MLPGVDFDSWVVPVLLLVLAGLLLVLLRAWRQNRHLLQTGEHMQALMDSIPDLTWVKDTQSRFLFVNAQFGKTFGRQPKSLVGLTDHDLSTPDAAAASSIIASRANSFSVCPTARSVATWMPLSKLTNSTRWLGIA